jgi:hypoxanthine phosphoribosyltransferase
MNKIRVFLTRDEIQNRVNEIAKQLCKDYKEILMICVLKGGIIFCSDLMRAITEHVGPKVHLEFLKAKSYEGTQSTTDVRIEYFDAEIEGKDVLIVEDIMDTGHTVKQIKSIMTSRGAKRVRICTLLDKPSRREIKQKAEYVGFEIPNHFVVGYGMDYNEIYRGLDYIGILE